MDKERTSDTLNAVGIDGKITKLPTPCSPEKTCGTCKFRGREIEGMDDDFNLVMTGFFQCQRIRFDANSQPKKTEGAVVQDGSGYHGKLCVEADFGCVKWESKNTEKREV